MASFADRLDAAISGAAEPKNASYSPASPRIAEELKGLSPEFSSGLDELVKLVGSPLTITSGKRSKELNDSLPGHAPNSFHLTGNAADVRVRDIPPETRAAVLAKARGIPGMRALDEGDHIHLELHGSGNPPHVADNTDTPSGGTFAERLEQSMRPDPAVVDWQGEQDKKETAARKAQNPDAEPHAPSFLDLFSQGMKEVPEKATQAAVAGSMAVPRMAAEAVGHQFPSNEEVRNSFPGKLMAELPANMTPAALAPLIGMLTPTGKDVSEWTGNPAHKLGEAIRNVKELLISPMQRTGQRGGVGPMNVLGPQQQIMQSMENLPKTLSEVKQDPTKVVFDMLMSLPGLGMGAHMLNKEAPLSAPAAPEVPRLAAPGNQVAGDATARILPLLEEPTQKIREENTERMDLGRQAPPVVELPGKGAIRSPEDVAPRMKTLADKLEEAMFPGRAAASAVTEKIPLPGEAPTEKSISALDSTGKVAIPEKLLKQDQNSGPTPVLGRPSQEFKAAELSPEGQRLVKDFSAGKDISKAASSMSQTEEGRRTLAQISHSQEIPNSKLYPGSVSFVDSGSPQDKAVAAKELAKLQGGKPAEGGNYLGSGLGGAQGLLGKVDRSSIDAYKGGGANDPCLGLATTGEKITENGITVPKKEIVSEGLKARLNGSRDLGGWDASPLSMADALRASEYMDGGPDGPIKQGFVDGANRTEQKALQDYEKNYKPKIDSIFKDSKMIQKVGEYKTAPEGAKTRLTPGELQKVQGNPALSGRIGKGVEVVRSMYENLYDRLVKAGVDVPHRKDYFAQIDSFLGGLKKAGLNESGAEPSAFAVANHPVFQHLEQRLNWGSKADAYAGLTKYAQQALRLIHGTEEISNMKALLPEMPPRGRQYFKRFVNEVMAGQPNEAQMTAAKAMPKTNYVANKLRQVFTRNAVVGNASVVIKHIASWANTVKSAGFSKFTGGLTRAMTDWKALDTKWKGSSPEYALRSSTAQYDPGFLGKTRQVAEFGLHQINRLQQLASLEAHEAKAKAQGLNPADARRYALDMTAKAQSSFLRSMQTPIMRHPLGKTFGVLQNFTINMSNYLRDLNRVAEAGGKSGTFAFLKSKEAVGHLFRFAGAALLTNLAYKSVGLESPYSKVANFIPFASSVDYGIPTPVYSTIQHMAQFASGAAHGDKRGAEDAIDQMVRDTATLAIPTQIQKTARGLEANAKGRVASRSGQFEYPIKGTAEKVRSAVLGPEKTVAAQKYKDKKQGQSAVHPVDVVLEALQAGGRILSPNFRLQHLKTPLGTLRRRTRSED